jgi:hypothetical protein
MSPAAPMITARGSRTGWAPRYCGVAPRSWGRRAWTTPSAVRELKTPARTTAVKIRRRDRPACRAVRNTMPSWIVGVIDHGGSWTEGPWIRLVCLCLGRFDDPGPGHQTHRQLISARCVGGRGPDFDPPPDHSRSHRSLGIQAGADHGRRRQPEHLLTQRLAHVRTGQRRALRTGYAAMLRERVAASAPPGPPHPAHPRHLRPARHVAVREGPRAGLYGVVVAAHLDEQTPLCDKPFAHLADIKELPAQLRAALRGGGALLG